MVLAGQSCLGGGTSQRIRFRNRPNPAGWAGSIGRFFPIPVWGQLRNEPNPAGGSGSIGRYFPIHCRGCRRFAKQTQIPRFRAPDRTGFGIPARLRRCVVQNCAELCTIFGVGGAPGADGCAGFRDSPTCATNHQRVGAYKLAAGFDLHRSRPRKGDNHPKNSFLYFLTVVWEAAQSVLAVTSPRQEKTTPGILSLAVADCVRRIGDQCPIAGDAQQPLF